jgi:hypothetical protein
VTTSRAEKWNPISVRESSPNGLVGVGFTFGTSGDPGPVDGSTARRMQKTTQKRN